MILKILKSIQELTHEQSVELGMRRGVSIALLKQKRKEEEKEKKKKKLWLNKLSLCNNI